MAETITNMVYDPATRVLTYTNEAGTVQTANLAEVLTTLSYNATTKILTYADELGMMNSIDLSALAQDTYVDGGSFNATSGILTLTDNSGTTPDVIVDLSALKATLVDNNNDTWTHTSSGVVTTVDATLSVAAVPTTFNYDGRIIELNNKFYKYLATPGTYIQVGL